VQGVYRRSSLSSPPSISWVLIMSWVISAHGGERPRHPLPPGSGSARWSRRPRGVCRRWPSAAPSSRSPMEPTVDRRSCCADDGPRGRRPALIARLGSLAEPACRTVRALGPQRAPLLRRTVPAPRRRHSVSGGYVPSGCGFVGEQEAAALGSSSAWLRLSLMRPMHASREPAMRCAIAIGVIVEFGGGHYSVDHVAGECICRR